MSVGRRRTDQRRVYVTAARCNVQFTAATRQIPRTRAADAAAPVSPKSRLRALSLQREL